MTYNLELSTVQRDMLITILIDNKLDEEIDPDRRECAVQILEMIDQQRA